MSGTENVISSFLADATQLIEDEDDEEFISAEEFILNTSYRERAFSWDCEFLIYFTLNPSQFTLLFALLS